MVQCLKVLAFKADNLYLIPKAHMIKREKELLQVELISSSVLLTVILVSPPPFYCCEETL